MEAIRSSLGDRVLFAIPKKGRLYEKCVELLAGADIQYTRSSRLDICLVRNHPLALVFLPASDIPRFVAEGNVTLGITGQDTVEESGVSHLLDEVLKLEFGACKLQVQVPNWSDIKTTEDLIGKKIATSFENVSRVYFDELEKKNPEKGKTIIEYVGGSVEAACGLGLSDGIVDLVESGDTMRAAGLHAISTILSSQAVLIKSKKPFQCQNKGTCTSANGEEFPIQPSAIPDMIERRLAGVVAAKRYVLCEYNVPRELISEAVKVTPGRRAPTISPLDGGEWCAIRVQIEKKISATKMDELQAMGAKDILIIPLTNCRV